MSHPILSAASAISQTLKSVSMVNPTFMATADKAAALTELARVGAQLDELRLRILAEAADLAATTAAPTPADWLAVATRGRLEEARAEQRLAVALDRRYPVLAAGMREGVVNQAQAGVIATGLDALPGEVSREILARAEQILVDHARRFGPRQLARLGRHILDVAAPEIADEAEARRLAALEQAAHRRTRLMLRRLGDGTTRLSGLLPDAAAARLATYLEAFTNPAKMSQASGDDTVAARHHPDDPLARLTYPRRLGEAFCQLLETLDPRRLPLHAGDATTVLVTIPLDQLRAELGHGEIIGASHTPGTDDPLLITAATARRLACTANIIPAVLGGTSQILDLGRTQRLYSTPQRKALQHRDRHCRAEGCTIPGTWCEAHHWLPWTHGGPTDLGNAVLLCLHHHASVHDPGYRAERLPHGDIRFHPRR